MLKGVKKSNIKNAYGILEPVINLYRFLNKLPLPYAFEPKLLMISSSYMIISIHYNIY